MMNLSKLSSLGFLLTSYMLLYSKEYALGEEWRKTPFPARYNLLNSVQLVALLVMVCSTVVMLSCMGIGIQLDQDQTKKVRVSSDVKPQVQRSYPRPAVKYFCVAVSLWSIVYCLFKAVARYNSARNTEWPPSFGLFCGLGSVAIAQVCLMVYLFLRRFNLLGNELSSKIQLKETVYEETFVQEVIHHFSNPGAFILMLPYLCLTWMFQLMPESYYDYDTPMSCLNVFLQLLVVDFFTYTFHVTEHSIPTLYRLGHKPHHRFVNPHMLNAFDGSLLDTVALILFPLFTTAQLMHVSNWDYIGFGTVYSSHFMLIHSEVSHKFEGLLSFFYINIAEDHHVHHATFNSNYGHFFTVYDQLFGTYKPGNTCKGFRSSGQTPDNRAS